MAVIKNIGGTSEQQFKIGIAGSTIRVGTNNPNSSPEPGVSGDLYVRSGGTPGLYQHDGSVWVDIINTLGGQIIAGNLGITGRLSVADGTVSSPGLRFTNSTNTGLYLSNTDILSVAVGGIQALEITPSDVFVKGNLYVQGSTTTVNSEHLVIEDNTIIVNNGEMGAGVTVGTAGIEIERGTLSNVAWLYEEATGSFMPSGVSRLTNISQIDTPSGQLAIIGTGALTIPVGTTAERPGTPVKGMIRIRSDLNQLEHYDGTTWVALLGGLGGFVQAGGDTMTGDLVMSSARIRWSNGSVLDPSATFDSDLDTGLYRVTTNTLGIATGGVSAATFSPSQIEFISDVLMSGNLDIDGVVTFNDTVNGVVTSVTGTANEIAVATGDSTPVLSLPAALTFTGKTVTGGTLSGVSLSGAVTNSGTISGGSVTALTAFGIRSSSAAFDLRFASNEVITNNRTMSFTVGDADRSITLGGNVSISSGFSTSGAGAITLTAGSTSNVTVPTTGTLATLTGAETLSNKTISSPSISGTVSGGATYSGITLSGNTSLPGTGIINSSGYFGIGTASPVSKLHILGGALSTYNAVTAPISAPLFVLSGDSTSSQFVLDTYDVGSSIIARRTNGTPGSETALTADQAIFSLVGIGRGSSSYSTTRAGIQIFAAESWTDTAQGTFVQFAMSPTGGASNAASFRWYHDDFSPSLSSGTYGFSRKNTTTGEFAFGSYRSSGDSTYSIWTNNSSAQPGRVAMFGNAATPTSYLTFVPGTVSTSPTIGSSSGITALSGTVQIVNSAVPGTPSGGVYLYSESGVLKWKDPSANVYPLAIAASIGAGDASLTTDITRTSADAGKTLLCDATNASFTVTLPTAASMAGIGSLVIIRTDDISANTLTLSTQGSDRIYGGNVWDSATILLEARGARVTLVSAGGHYYVESYNDGFNTNDVALKSSGL